MNRPLHLKFGGVAVAGDGLFDAIGGELFDYSAGSLGDEHDHAAGVAHHDGRARVGVVGIQLLDGADRGLMFDQQRVEFTLEFNKTIGQ